MNRPACVLCGPLLTPTVRQSSLWRTAVNRNQNLLGKLIIVLGRHEERVAALSPGEWAELHAEIRWATDRLGMAFAPDHYNYAFLQNEDRHVHLHVIPRYGSSRELAGIKFRDEDFPGPYRVPGPEFLVDREALDAIANALRL